MTITESQIRESIEKNMDSFRRKALGGKVSGQDVADLFGYGEMFNEGEESEIPNKKNLSEDKLLAKEDDMGGAAPIGGGEVSAPPSEPVADNSVSEPPSGAVSYHDIIGKCDHQHDQKGFFHKGCMHRPFPLFTMVPYYGKPKKKRKVKVIDLTESDDFTNFVTYCKQELQILIKKANEELKKIDSNMSVVLDEDYEFSDYKSDWVAALNKSGQKDINEFIVGFNYKVLYEFLYDQGLELDDTEIRCQLTASLYHEIGHALIQWFRDKDIYDFEIDEDEEEKIVEEYANFKLGEYTNVKSSRLQKFIDEIF